MHAAHPLRLVALRSAAVLTAPPPLAQGTPDSAGTASATPVRDSLTAMRGVAHVSQILWSVGQAALATLIFVVVLRVLLVGYRAAVARLRAFGVRKFRAITVAGFTLLTREQIAALFRRLVELLAWAAGLIATYAWITFVLGRFALSRPWGDALAGWLAATLGQLALGALDAVPGLLTVIIIFLVARFLTRLVSAFFKAVEAGSVELPWIHPDIAQPTRRLAIILLWMFAVVVAFPYIPGSDSQAFKGLSVFIGLMLSLGSTGLVNQAMSGLVLMYARALKHGEYVRIGSVEGTVIHVGLLSTGIRTIANEVVTIPNAVVVSNGTMNFSRGVPDGLLLYTSVTIGFDAPWRQVHALLRRAADRTPGLGRDPEPFVLQRALSDYYVEYELRARLERADQRVPVLAALHENIQDAFNEFGVQIMSPHFRQQPAEPVVVPRDRWYAAPASPP